MFGLFSLILFLILYFTYKISHNLFHPAFITAFVWFLSVASYYFYIKRTNIWISLSDKFYIIVLLYIITFTITSISISQKSWKLSRIYLSKFEINKKNKFLVTICTLILILLIFEFIKLANASNPLNIIYNVRKIAVSEDEGFSFSIKICMYAMPLAAIFIFAFYNYRKNGIDKLFYVILFFLLLMSSLFMSTKGSILQFICCIMFLLYIDHKLNAKKIFFIIMIGVFLILLLQYVRSSNSNKFNISELIYIYFLSPLPAFDELINNKLQLKMNMIGGNSFAFLYRLFYKFNLIKSMPVILWRSHNWTSVPYPTNVYTSLASFYIDFGIIGIFINGFVSASIFSFIYNFALKNKSRFFCIFYGLYVYNLIFQFFGEWFFGFFSITIQTFLFLCLVNIKFKIH
ncbi:O-antigen polymerase [Leadbettera azotonutricia]|uniref:Putative membrane protein n=1 Tax=Leadbettera azotonutricia (strain ATCC BAA-888 / DSM 13862 / ZAS-9) TaxID=545695 RepID=F5YAK0_LEAAZ|nr:O-antigen polymerase [Leadbettera azotonutricia]AEF83481.1 putative membrane protein [Leadbettera azotonutricia ZAS-9]